MLRSFTDFLYGAKRVATIAAKRFPGEPVFLASGATVLETKDTVPVGRSPRRYLQLRGTAVFTDRRVFCKAPWLSPALVLFLPTIALSIGIYALSQDTGVLIGGVALAVLVWQRRPFEIDVPFDSIRDIRLAEVSGAAMRGDLVALGLGDHAIQIVIAQRLPDDLRRFLLHQADLARRRAAASV